MAAAAATADRFDLGPRTEVLWPGGPLRTRIRRLRRLTVLAAGADVVHAQGHQAGLLALVAVAASRPVRRGPRPAVVISWHNAVLGTGPARRARAALEAIEARLADLVTGASQDLVDRAAGLGARSTVLAPVAAPVAPPDTLSRGSAREAFAAELDLDPDRLWVLTVSRIAPQKNLHVLVDAAHQVETRRRAGSGRPTTAAEWIVVGDGRPDLLADLRTAAATGGARVHFVGARRDVAAWMVAADLFVLTSAWESRALVLQEAMGAGLPVVATAVGGVPELMGDAGRLVAPGDPEALADAVLQLVGDAAERAALARAGRDRYARLPDEAEVVEQWLGRYARLTASRR